MCKWFSRCYWWTTVLPLPQIFDAGVIAFMCELCLQSAAVAVAASAQQAVASLIKSLVLLGPSIYHGNVGLQQLQTWSQLFAKLIDMVMQVIRFFWFRIELDYLAEKGEIICISN